MARLNFTTDITTTVTRQTLDDIWEQATVTDLQPGDFDFSGNTDLGVAVADNWSSAPTGPSPGKLFYHQGEQLMYVWTDALDNTGVSLWLSLGPDVFEAACLAAGPIPAGAVVSPLYDRWVTLASTETAGALQNWYPIGVNQSGLPEVDDLYSEGDTAQSGAWIRVAIDGLPRGWFPKGETGVSEHRFGMPKHYSGGYWVGVLPMAANGLPYGGGLGPLNGGDSLVAVISNQIGISLECITHYSGSQHMYRRIKWGGHMNSSV